MVQMTISRGERRTIIETAAPKLGAGDNFCRSRVEVDQVDVDAVAPVETGWKQSMGG